MKIRQCLQKEIGLEIKNYDDDLLSDWRYTENIFLKNILLFSCLVNLKRTDLQDRDKEYPFFGRVLLSSLTFDWLLHAH